VKASLLLKLRQVRQLALSNESLRKLGIHAVEAENHGTLNLRLARRLSAAEQTK
jgi:hypothetical protein